MLDFQESSPLSFNPRSPRQPQQRSILFARNGPVERSPQHRFREQPLIDLRKDSGANY